MAFRDGAHNFAGRECSQVGVFVEWVGKDLVDMLVDKLGSGSVAVAFGRVGGSRAHMVGK